MVTSGCGNIIDGVILLFSLMRKRGQINRRYGSHPFMTVLVVRMLLRGHWMCFRKTVQCLQPKSIFLQTIRKRFLVKIYGNKVQKQFLHEENDSCSQEDLLMKF